MDRRKNRAVVAGALLALGTFEAHALQLVDLAPRGEVSRVRQVVATFDEAAVDFGDPRAPAPFTVRCDDVQAGRGTPRWTGAKRWVFDFAADLPPGMRCTVERVAGFRSASGVELKAPERTLFTTGGPAVRTLWPSYGKIDERQTFVLELNGVAAPASLRENVWCAADGPGERIPVALVEGAERDAALQAVGRDKAARAEPLRFAALRCNRTLTAGGRVQVVYGKGVATPSGVANSVERRFDFEVREPFAATFACERENAQAACLPLRPMTLHFNAPVTRGLAARIRLEGRGEARKPTLDDDGGGGGEDAVIDSLSFAAPFPEYATFSVV
ncbi:MAG: alpha-2-macroglobulin, partial [Variovorax sp.]